MVLPDRVRVVVGVTSEVPGPFQGGCILHPVVETLVVAPHAQHVVGPLLPDLARDRLLAAHGIEGNDAARQAQHVQQLRDGRDFVGPVLHRRLGLRLGADQVQGLQTLAPVGGAAHTLALYGYNLAVG